MPVPNPPIFLDQWFADATERAEGLPPVEEEDDLLPYNPVVTPFGPATTADTGAYPTGGRAHTVSFVFQPGRAVTKMILGSPDNTLGNCIFYRMASDTLLTFGTFNDGVANERPGVPISPQAGQVIAATVFADGASRVTIDGVQVRSEAKSVWPTALPGIVQGQYAALRNDFGSAFADVTITAEADPLRIVTAKLDDDKLLIADIEYRGSGAPYDLEIYAGTTLVLNAAPMALIANLEPGKASLKATAKAGAAQEGSILTYRIRQRGSATIAQDTTLLFPGTPQFGTNIGGPLVFVPFEGDRALANLLHAGDISGAPGWEAGVDHIAGRINSLPSGPLYWGMCRPDADGAVDLTWEGDPNATFGLEVVNADGLVISSLTSVGPNRKRMTFAGIDWSKLQYVRLVITSVGSGIENVDMREQVMDRALRWAPNYVARQALMIGPIRVMDVIRTNAQVFGTLEWADRNTPYSLFFCNNRTGIPVEYIIELARRTGRAPWYNAYYNASDDFNLKLAQALDTGANTVDGIGLPAAMPLLIEPINEGWNDRFAINGAMRQRGFAEGRLTANERDQVGEFNIGVYKEQAFAHDRIMERIEAGVTSGRPLVRIAGIQIHPSAYQWTKLLEFGITRADAVAAAPYWKVEDNHLPDDLSVGSVHPLYMSAMDAVMDELAGCGQVVRATGKRFLAYEGGSDYANNSRFSGQPLATYYRSPEQGLMYEAAIGRWRIEHGDIWCHYADRSQNSARTSNVWGLDEYIGQPSDQTPRLNAWLVAQ